MEINNFDQWLDTLGTALEKAKAAGLPNKLISKSAAKLGDFLAENIKPDIPENRLLKEMWTVGGVEEQEALVSMLIKLIENRKIH
ncbi:DUF3243 domain-containing protein [Zhaonella formicivorans]|uniref:DUF3243 domain-containing protein n=1 Tax=Zhaonella formicivorans TaxID=2528593 RepID=UPI0010EC7C47|nr:DUF3243 domain-containing protein [Zhaonella formicivorans]